MKADEGGVIVEKVFDCGSDFDCGAGCWMLGLYLELC